MISVIGASLLAFFVCLSERSCGVYCNLQYRLLPCPPIEPALGSVPGGPGAHKRRHRALPFWSLSPLCEHSHSLP